MPVVATYCVEVHPNPLAADPGDPGLARRLQDAGAPGVRTAHEVRLFLLDGELDAPTVVDLAQRLLVDPLTERVVVRRAGEPPAGLSTARAVEVHPRPGVMDPTAETALTELRGRGYPVAAVRTGRRYIATGTASDAELAAAAARVLANDCIEEIVPGLAPVRPAPTPPQYAFELRTVALRDLDSTGLERLSRAGHLFLSSAEMQAVQSHFSALGRDPTDLELETIAQTWSEHCVHKTLKSAYVYRGAPLGSREGAAAPRPAAGESVVELRYANLLQDTIARATTELIAEGRGPQCLSVFQDNAGVIGFDDDYGIAFKVETHNHPSAIEPYGGAATGVGGCIRDVIGCGLGARPIANTDVFCVAPPDWPQAGLPRGVLHPGRVLRGIVQGVADYGNRMGIPTVNGAVYIDPRYLGNPLVYCGCVGLIPRNRIAKAARPGDRIVLIGGRTGRDGIHGATFSSAELTDAHADEFSHAVQIGNAITEKRVLDAVLAARDAAGGCLYTAITDCGAGGLSSAVGEMGAAVGAAVDLERVPLKYSGLRYDEIWVSEAQERMVLAVPPDNVARLLQIMADEEVEATLIGRFGPPEAGQTPTAAGAQAGPRLIVRFNGAIVGDLDMHFLHDGLPRRAQAAEWHPPSCGPYPHADLTAPNQPRPVPPPDSCSAADVLDALAALLASHNVVSREWIIRRYDHEVQGGSVVKPLCGPGAGPGDAAVVRPRPESLRGVALGCGLAPHLSDADPYWMAVNAIDEAVRNVVAVGGDAARIAILDNFCWGRSDDPQNLGALVRACQACYDAAKAYGTPFISGKDSLNNEFLLDPRDTEPLLRNIEEHLHAEPLGQQRAGPLAPAAVARAIAQRIRATGRIGIPPTLLISALALVPDVRRCITADLKQPGHALLLLGGFPQLGFPLAAAARVHTAVSSLIQAGAVVACHDVSDGGWLLAVAEMAIAANCGVDLRTPSGVAAFAELAAGYVVEAADAAAVLRPCAAADVAAIPLGTVRADEAFRLDGAALPIARLAAAWRGPAANAR